MTNVTWYPVVVYRSSWNIDYISRTVIKRSDDWFLNLVVDSDSIGSKIFTLNFVLWLNIFICDYTDNQYCSYYPSWVFFALILTNIWEFLSKRWKCMKTALSLRHIFGLVYYLGLFPGIVHLYTRCYTYGKRCILFCSKLMFNATWIPQAL